MIPDFFCNSQIGKQYISLLNDPKITYISLDVFDTAVYRSAQFPTDVFSAMGEEPLTLSLFGSAASFARYRVEAEKNARKYHTKEDITLREIYDEINIVDSDKERLIEIELKFEDKFLYPNPIMNIMIELAKKHHKNIIFLSDMYLSSTEIYRIALSKLSHKVAIESIFVSNEHNATKATGNLFRKAMNRLNLEAENLVHIGDNTHSDFKVPSGMGIKAIHFQNDEYLHQIRRTERAYIGQPIEYTNYLVQANLLNPYSEEEERFYFDLGASLFGPILWDFSLWMKSIHASCEYKYLFLMMREGRLFTKVLKLVAPELPIELFYASRKSTFLLNLDPDDLNISSLNYFNYRSLSVADFYAHFKLSIVNVDIIAHANETLEQAQNIHLEGATLFELITADLHSRLDEIKSITSQEHQSFLNYLKSIHYESNSFLFDFGASGSAIKNITKFLSKYDTPPKGYGMFYMHPSAYASHLTNRTYSFLPTGEADESFVELIKRSPEIIEILFNGQTTTTLSYEKAQPILEISSPQSDEIAPLIEAFDKGIEVFIHILFANHISMPLGSPRTNLRILSRLIELPHPREVKFLGKLYHDEGCGSTQMNPLITEDRVKILQQNPLSETYRKLSENIWLYQKEIPWIHGTISTIDPEYLLIMKQIKSFQKIQNPAVHSIVNKLISKAITHGVIYGAGQFCLELLEELKAINFIIDAIVDTRAFIQSFDIENHRVVSPSSIIASLSKNDVVIIASNMFVTEIAQTILGLNKDVSIISASSS